MKSAKFSLTNTVLIVDSSNRGAATHRNISHAVQPLIDRMANPVLTYNWLTDSGVVHDDVPNKFSLTFSPTDDGSYCWHVVKTNVNEEFDKLIKESGWKGTSPIENLTEAFSKKDQIIPGARYAFFLSRSANLYTETINEPAHGETAIKSAFKRLGAEVEIFYIDGSVQNNVGLVRIP